MSKVAFLFPGQGAQTVGMAAPLCAESSEARALFEKAADVLGYDLLKLCAEGPKEALDATDKSQPAIYVASLAALEKLRADNAELIDSCQAAAGLSLGEYTALAFAGAMDFETGLKLVKARGEAMQAASNEAPGGMVSILGLDHDRVAALCDEVRQEGEVLHAVNLLCPGNTAASGHKTACERLATAAEEAGAMKAIPLAVAGAFHTSLMGSATEKLGEAIETADLQPPRIPVYSNVDAAPYDDPAEIRKLLLAQITSPVLWEKSVRALLADGYDEFYEIGPGRVLKGLMKRIDRKTACENVVA